MIDFDALRKYMFGGNPNLQPAGNGLTGGVAPTGNTYQLPNMGGTFNLQGLNPPAEAVPTPTAMPSTSLPTGGNNMNSQQMSQAKGLFPEENPVASSQGGQSGDFSNDDIASQLNSALYGVSRGGGSQMSPTQQYFALRGQQADDRANGTGLYFIDPSQAYSPDQIRQIHNAADQAYSSQLDAIAPEALAAGKPELTAGQASLFNSIVQQRNKSPLIAAANRVPVLQASIKNVRANPGDAALQLNLAYSYIQALDTYQSAVREGELSLVNSIDSKVGQLNNYISQMTNGQIVRPEVAKQIADAAEKIVETINDGARAADQSYDSQARAVGLGDTWSKYRGGFTPNYQKSDTPDQTGSDWDF